MAGETFAELRIAIRQSIEALEEAQKDHAKRITSHDVEIAIIKAKAAILGMIAGVAVNVIFQLLRFLK